VRLQDRFRIGRGTHGPWFALRGWLSLYRALITICSISHLHQRSLVRSQPCERGLRLQSRVSSKAP
jgi:hypothetical protein